MKPALQERATGMTPDVLVDPYDTLTVVFDSATTPGECEVCVTASPDGAVDDTFEACGAIRVD